MSQLMSAVFVYLDRKWLKVILEADAAAKASGIQGYIKFVRNGFASFAVLCGCCSITDVT